MKIKFLALVALLGAMSSNALAADNDYALDKTNGVRYTFDNTETGKDGTTLATAFSAHVYGPTTAVTSMVVPASFTTTDENGVTKYFKVTGFLAGWGNTDVTTPAKEVRAKVTTTLTTLTIDGTYMGNMSNVFTNLTALKKLTVSSDNASWTNEGYVTGHMALGTALETIEELDLSGLTKVEALAGDFKVSGNNWKKLTTLSLPANLTAIPANCFEGSNVTALTIPESVATIGAIAFKNSALTAIDLSKTKVTAIENFTFESCKDLATVTLPAGLTSIGTAAFYGDEALTAITIPEGVTVINNQTFQNCSALATVTGISQVTSIGDYAFSGTAITAFEVPVGVTSIGASAFEGCESLATFTVAARAKETDPYKLASLGASLFKGCAALASVDLTNTAITAALGKKIFQNCAALAEIKLPKTVTDLCGGLFEDAIIEDLDLSETGITTLWTIFGARTAGNTNPLKSILLPAGLTTLKANVFDYSAIEEITIPATLTSDIPSKAFYYCTALKTVTYEPTSTATAKAFNNEAFLGCTPFVKIITNSYYFDANGFVEPTNATFTATEDLVVTPFKDNGTSGKYFAKICPTLDIMISKEDLGDAKLYSVYVDEGIAYFQALKVQSGFYNIAKGEHAILKANDATPINFEIGAGGGSINDDYIFSFAKTVPTAGFQEHTDWAYFPTYPGDGYVLFTAGTDYIYALTNSAKNGGFGFTYYSGATLPAGAFFLLSDLAPNKGARIETVWLDEDGNVEGDATAIKNVKAATEDGAIYNVSGQKVSASYKGLVIKDGKKYIQK